jgi:NAD(P)H-flavin reductase
MGQEPQTTTEFLLREAKKGRSRAVTRGGILGAVTLIIILYLSGQSTPPKILDAPRFTPFTIVAKEEISPTSVLLTLRPTSLAFSKELVPDPYMKSWERGTWSVEFKQPQLQIARSYTPLPPTEHNDKGELRFLIRKEHKGEVSSYLYNLPVGARIQLRGPHPEIDLPRDVTDVVFLAGGTGITPALQMIDTFFKARKMEKRPKIHIIWANRRREDCEGGISLTQATLSSLWHTVTSSKTDQSSNTLVQEIQDLQKKFESLISVDYLVDEEGTFLDQKKILQLTKTDSEVKFGPATTKIDSKLILVSGPEGFVSYLAGPKKWEGGKEGQGELGGLLGQMRLRDWKVYKL